jgi:UDP-N-acetylglucosamine enolpyruvyl transferase
MKEKTIKVEMIGGPETATRMYHQYISKFGSLGREIKISPKSHITFNKPGFKTEFFVDSVSLLIGIGNDNTADLIMSKESWEALVAGEEINIDTLKEFKEKYL